jgi:hypothetical protein
MTSNNARAKAVKMYVGEATKIVKLLDRGMSTLMINPDAPVTIHGMLERCHHLEHISIQKGQDLIAYLSSKMGSSLVQVLTAPPTKKKEHLIFLKDFLGSLKRAVESATEKGKYLTKIKKFEMEMYIEKANEIVEFLGRDLSKLEKHAGAPGTIWGMLERCRYLERVSLQNEQYLIASLVSKMSSSLAQVAAAPLAKRKNT